MYIVINRRSDRTSFVAFWVVICRTGRRKIISRHFVFDELSYVANYQTLSAQRYEP